MQGKDQYSPPLSLARHFDSEASVPNICALTPKLLRNFNIRQHPTPTSRTFNPQPPPPQAPSLVCSTPSPSRGASAPSMLRSCS
jgi:hypothetical protein